MINVFDVTSSKTLSSICAWGGVEYINHPNTVINVCLRWRRIHYSSKYCHQCVLELASDTLLLQILSSMCAWGDVEYINHPNTVINVCLRWRRIHHSSKYCHQCVLEVALNTLIIQILSSMCAWGVIVWLMCSTSPQAHIDDSIWMINVFNVTSSTHWWQYLDD
jgi:hypothetical protein